MSCISHNIHKYCHQVLIIKKIFRGTNNDYQLGELLRAELLSSPSADCCSLLCDASHTLEQGSQKQTHNAILNTIRGSSSKHEK